MADKKGIPFTVETIKPVVLNTLQLQTVVLVPAKDSEAFKSNPRARVELTNLLPDQAEGFEVGGKVTMTIDF